MSQQQFAVPDQSPMGEPSPLGLVGKSELCWLLQVSRPTLDKIIKDPDEDFPTVFKIGKRKFARFEDILGWIARKARAV